MIIRQRAIQVEDKQERYQAILDAAERVLMRSPDQSANVAEVAEAAGLAKGTVYLYFQSKEELLLALFPFWWMVDTSLKRPVWRRAPSTCTFRARRSYCSRCTSATSRASSRC